MKRDFKKRFDTMQDNISGRDYYTDFDKVYRNINKYKIELSILNSLVGSKNIEDEFKNILEKYPEVLKVIPLLLAKREEEIKITDPVFTYNFNFKNSNYSVEDYTLFMKKTGLFELLENHIINNLIDYALGIEVGLDSNARKNRTGKTMEDIVESFLILKGLILNKTYFKQMSKSEIERTFKLDLSSIKEKEKGEKRFDFVFVGAFGRIYAIECNFYNSNGSKQIEVARSYQELFYKSLSIKGFEFIWITDGLGWVDCQNSLKESFDIIDNLFNINDLRNEALNKFIDIDKSIN